MVGVVNQFPMVGASFMGAYRDARQNRLAEAAARAQMAAAEAQRRQQAETQQAFGRLTSPAPAIGFDTGVAQGAVSTYTPEQQQQDLAAVFMGGMGGDLAAYREFTSPAARQEPSEYAQTLFRRAATLIENGTPEEEAYGVVSSALGMPISEVAVNVAALGPGQQRMTALQQRAFDAGLQPGTAEYQEFMLRGGQGYAPRQSNVPIVNVNYPGSGAGASSGGGSTNPNDYRPGEVVSARAAGFPGAAPNEMVQATAGRYGNTWEPVNVNEGAAEEAIRLLRSGEVEGTRNVAGVTYMTPEAVQRAGYPEGTVVRVETDAQGNIQDVVSVEPQSSEDRRRYENLLRNQATRDREVLYSAGQSLSNVNNWSTGVLLEVSRAFSSGEEPLAGTPAADLYASLMQLRANLGFEALQNIRDASPTGGALGPVSDTENALLQNAMAAILQSQTPGQLRQNLARLARLRAESLNRRASILRTESPEIYRSIYGSQEGWPTVGETQGGQRGATYVYVGGDPSDRRNWELLIPGS